MSSKIREHVTQRIIEALESGKTLPWRRPWSVSGNAGRPTSLSSRRPYSGVNVPLLQIHADRFGFQSKWWGTYRSWQSLGLQVKKRPSDVRRGEWGASIVFYKLFTKSVPESETDDDPIKIPLLRSFVVFNSEQVEGAEKYQVIENEHDGIVLPDFAPAEKLIEATEADIRFGGEQAFFDKNSDYIQMPHKHRFDPPGSFYETILHELSHWSLNQRRMDWKASNEQHAYAEEELVAEMASSFLATELGVPQGESLDNHASYLRSWLGAMKADNNFIFKASTQASKVSDFLLSFVEQQAEQPEPAIIV